MALVHRRLGWSHTGDPISHFVLYDAVVRIKTQRSVT